MPKRRRGPVPKLAADQKQSIELMLDLGHAHATIESNLGLTPGTVGRHVFNQRRRGVIPPRFKLTEDQKKSIKSMLNAGHQQAEVDAKLGLPPETTRKYVFNERRQRRMPLADFRPDVKWAHAHDMWNNGKTMLEIALHYKVPFTTIKGIVERYRKNFGWFKKGSSTGRPRKFAASESPELSSGRTKSAVDIPAFKEWFSGSKVVDESGAPKRVFHGTTRSFDQFNTGLPDGQDWGMINNGIGSHFAEDPSVSGAFSTGHYVRPTDYAVSEYDPSQSWYRHKGELIYGKGTPTLLKEDRHGREVLEPYDPDKHGSSYFLRENHGSGARIVMMPPGGQTHAVYLNIKHPLVVDPQKSESDQGAISRAIANKVFPLDRQLFIDALKATGRMNGGAIWDAIKSGHGYNGGEYEKYKTFDDVSRNFSGLLGGMDNIARAKSILKSLGYDGIKYRNTSRNEVKEGDNPWAWIAFHPTQIKSATGNRGTFDKNNPDTRMQRLDNLVKRFSASESPELSSSSAKKLSEPIAPTFYSHAERVIKDKVPNAAAPDQVKKTLLNNGVKPEEMKWSGIEDHLAGAQGPVKKEDLLNLARTNNVKLKEVMKGDEDFRSDRHRSLLRQSERADAEGVPLTRRQQEELEAYRSDEEDNEKSKTKYKDYQLPGGSNYRELLLSLPEDNKRNQISKEAIMRIARSHGVDSKEYKDAYQEFVAPKTNDFHSQHWDEPNVLGHIRFNDRVGPNGEKLLHLDEVQSDWHQVGRKEGYKDHQGTVNGKDYQWWQSKKDSLFDKMIVLPIGSQERQKLESEYVDTIDATRRLKDSVNSVPDAPFKRTWHELLLRRALRYAAEHGYQGLSWTPGEEQAKRYDLSKQIDEIAHKKNPDGTYHVEIAKDGTNLDVKPKMTESELESYVGKEMAKKIVSGEGKRDGILKYITGDNLSVGGEGMRGFYDKIVPDYLNKYGKKWGAKVGSTEIETSSVDDHEHPHEYVYDSQKIGSLLDEGGSVYVKNSYSGSSQLIKTRDELKEYNKNNIPNTYIIASPVKKSVPFIPITDAMRKSVLHEGQALFSRKDRPVRFSNSHNLKNNTIAKAGRILLEEFRK